MYLPSIVHFCKQHRQDMPYKAKNRHALSREQYFCNAIVLYHVNNTFKGTPLVQNI